MTFKKWIIKNHIAEDNAIGDLARDINADMSFPDVRGYLRLCRYLEDMGANDGALKAFNSAYFMYFFRERKGDD